MIIATKLWGWLPSCNCTTILRVDCLLNSCGLSTDIIFMQGVLLLNAVLTGMHISLLDFWMSSSLVKTSLWQGNPCSFVMITMLVFCLVRLSYRHWSRNQLCLLIWCSSWYWIIILYFWLHQLGNIRLIHMLKKDGSRLLMLLFKQFHRRKQELFSSSGGILPKQNQGLSVHYPISIIRPSSSTKAGKLIKTFNLKIIEQRVS